MSTRILQQAWLTGLAKLVKMDLLTTYDLRTVATYGFPGVNMGQDIVRGVCYKAVTPENRDVILIHPAEWAKAESVIRTFLHEAVHSVCQKDEGHGAVFHAAAEAIGLMGELRDTPGPVLSPWIARAIGILPPMPSDPLARDPRFQPEAARKPQKGRMKLFQCSCGFKIRCGRAELQAACDLCHSKFEMIAKEGGSNE